MTTRSEHMVWCKQRALEVLDDGDILGAYQSMVSDLGKHPETLGHVGIDLGMMMQLSGMLRTTEQMRDFIIGFN